jgi:DNA-binding MarR family transcriptional regulator
MTKREAHIEQLASLMFERTKMLWRKSQRARFKGGYDLSESEFLTLDALEGGGTVSVGQLRRCVAVLPSQMSRIIKALEQRYEEKLVVCSINAQDKRKIDVAITPRGRRAVDSYRKFKLSQISEWLSRMPDDDLVAFERILDRYSPEDEPEARP